MLEKDIKNAACEFIKERYADKQVTNEQELFYNQGFMDGARWKSSVWHSNNEYPDRNYIPGMLIGGSKTSGIGEECLVVFESGEKQICQPYYSENFKYWYFEYLDNQISINRVFKWAYLNDIIPM